MEGGEISGASGMAVVAMATTEEEDTNAASVKLLIIEVPNLWTDKTDCHSSGLAVIFHWLSVRVIDVWLVEISII